MKKRAEITLVIVVIVLTSLLIGAYVGPNMLFAEADQEPVSDSNNTEDEHDHSAHAPQLSKIALKNIGAEVQEVHPQQYYLTKDVSGMVVKTKWATISVTSSLSGIIREVFVREGYGVKPGENLASLEVTDDRVLGLLLALIDLDSQVKLTKIRQDALVDERTASIELELLSLQQEYENITTQLSFKDGDKPSLAGDMQISLTEAVKELKDSEAEKNTITKEIERLKDAGDAIAQQEILKNEYRLKELEVITLNINAQIKSLKSQITAERYLLEQRQKQINEQIILRTKQKTAVLNSIKIELDNIEIQRKSIVRQLKILSFPEDLINEVLAENKSKKHFSPIILIKAPEKNSSGKEFVIESRFVNTGQYLEAGSELFNLTDLWELWVRAEVYESQIHDLRLDLDKQNANVWFPGQQDCVSLELLHIEHNIDSNSRLGALNFKLDNTKLSNGTSRFLEMKYKPGTRVNVSVPLTEYSDVYVLPNESVVTVGAEKFIYINHDNTFEKLEVAPIAFDSKNVVIPRIQISCHFEDSEEHAVHSDEDDHDEAKHEEHSEDCNHDDDDTELEGHIEDCDHDDDANHVEEAPKVMIVVKSAYRLHLALQQLQDSSSSEEADEHAGCMH